MQRESMEFDVLVVGGGPAELAAAIRLKQLAAQPHGWQRREALSLAGSGFLSSRYSQPGSGLDTPSSPAKLPHLPQT